MPLQKRVIPVVQLEGKKQVKTRQFKSPRYIGNPVNTAKVFYEMGVHELAIIDITGTLNLEMLKKIAKQLFIPLSYGGGIHSLDNARDVIQFGAEKVILNSATTMGMIEELADEFGKQSVMVSIDHNDARQTFMNHGQTPTGFDVINLAKDVVRWGCGEILLNNIQRDGEMIGYNNEILKNIVENVNVPVVALGGAGTRSDIRSALEAGCWGAAAGSLFCYKDKKRQVCVNYIDARIP